MAFIEIQRNDQEINIRISYKRAFLLLFIIAIILAIPGGVFGYKYYLAHFYDSSTSKSELKDFNPPPPPPDIKKQIQQIEKKTIIQSNTPTISIASNINSSTASAKPQSATISATVRVPIIMYHYVEYVQNKNDKLRIALNTTPYVLENEIQTLIAAGYNFITNNDLSDVLDGKTNLPANPILLTFDDGYRDFYTDAYPILKKYRVKATNYVIAGFLNRNNHLLTSQVQEISNDGLVEIGAHTVNHVWLKGLQLNIVSDEVFQSKEILEQLIHKPVLSFAYPFGAFDDQAIKVVKDSGFRSAVSTIPGVNQNQEDRFYMFRLRPGGATGKGFLNIINQTKFNPY